MAGKLVQVDSETVSSAVASVTLIGIDSDDVYMLLLIIIWFVNVYDTDGVNVYFRILDSGNNADTDLIMIGQ